MTSIGLSVSLLIFQSQKVAANTIKSTQSYFIAESGVEDSLLRLGKGWNTPASYSLAVAEATAEVTISSISAGSRTIASEGNSSSHFRKIEVVYQLSGAKPGFFYGAQVGEGGLRMDNSSRVVGNVYSNGNAQLTGTAQITDTISVAGTGKKISGGEVLGDAYSDICENTEIGGTLHANTQSNCSYSSFTSDGLPIDPLSLPIPNSQIEEWKNEAAAGGTIGSFNKSSGTHILGPVKIEGDLIVQNTAQLVITGTLWVTGNIDIKNSAQVRLDPSYGSTSGVIVASGLITLQNSSISSGSGSAGSYLMYISTSSADPAVIVKNFAIVDVLYSNTGWVAIENNTDMRSVNSYGIHVKNSAELTYEIGLADALFTSGPAAGWTVTSWQEQ